MHLAISAIHFLQGPLDAVQEAIRKMGGVSFSYEAEYERIGDENNKRRMRRQYTFTGSLTIKADTGLVLSESRAPHPVDEWMISKASYSPKHASYTYQLESKKMPLMRETGRGGYDSILHVGYHRLETWFPAAALLVGNSEDSAAFTDHGDELKDDRRLRVLSHTIAIGKTFRVERRYWIDLSRNGVVSKAEFRFNGEKTVSMSAKEQRSFKGASGRQVWLPTVIAVEQFLTSNTTAKETGVGAVVSRTTYRIILESVKLDDKPAIATSPTALSIPTKHQTPNT